MKRLAAPLLILMLVAPVAHAWPGKRARHRDDTSMRVRHGDYNNGMHWTRDVRNVDFCYPVLQRRQDRARHKLRPGWLVVFVSNNRVVDWMKDGRGDRLQGENPCLGADVQAGAQPPPLAKGLAGSAEEAFDALNSEGAGLPAPVTRGGLSWGWLLQTLRNGVCADQPLERSAVEVVELDEECELKKTAICEQVGVLFRSIRDGTGGPGHHAGSDEAIDLCLEP